MSFKMNIKVSTRLKRKALLLFGLMLSVGIYTLITIRTNLSLNYKVTQTDYVLITDKNIPDLKIAMFSDSHIGTISDTRSFTKRLLAVQSQNPDLVVIVGDYIDELTTKKQMINSIRALGKMKTKYGIYYVFGNHDISDYSLKYRNFSQKDLFDELQKNNINLLQDDSVLIDNAFYLIGRRDFSVVTEQGKTRASIKDLIKHLDKNKYIIVLDHQPTDFTNQTDAGVNLVLCGHTHGGQYPFNKVKNLEEKYNLVYGHKKLKNTDFIVTYGFADWSTIFNTENKSEFIFITIKKNNNFNLQKF